MNTRSYDDLSYGMFAKSILISEWDFLASKNLTNRLQSSFSKVLLKQDNKLMGR